MSNRAELIEGFLDGFRPIKRMLVSDWSNQYRYLSNIASARPGKYDMSFTPYLEEIVDNLSEYSPISRVIFKKGAQIGATEIGNNWIGSIIHIAPAATLMVMPTDDTVRRNSKIRIDPMIAASPELRKRIKPARSRDSSNTTTQKEFPGGVLIMTGANSAASLRSMPIKNLMLDEVDGYPSDLDGEGSPIELARARTITYANKKKELLISTPTIEGMSVIDDEFKDSDQRYYYVPCPRCGLLQTIMWEKIKWPDGNPDNAKMQCEGCDELIEERHKFWMVSKAAGAHWKAHNPNHIDKRKRGYHLSGLYSTLGFTWADAAKQWLAAQGNPTKLKAFENIVKGECYKENLDAPEWSNLYARREGYLFNIPKEPVAFITMGVDIQHNRIELEIVGWAKRKESWSLRYQVLEGDTSSVSNPVWDKLSDVINETFIREDGVEMPIRMTAIDSSDQTSVVHEFCKRFDTNKVIPIKGNDKMDIVIGIPKPVEYSMNGKAVGKSRHWGVGVSMVKTELYGWFKSVHSEGKEVPIGYCHFPQHPEEYFKMLVAEKKQMIINKKGYKELKWVLPSHARNEALDCRVYARAAAAAIGMDRFGDRKWDELRWQYKEKPPEVEQAVEVVKAPVKKKNNFLGGDKFWP